MVDGCAPDDLVRISFAILRTLTTTHYLFLKIQGLHEALPAAHVTMAEDQDVRVRKRAAAPTVDVGGPALARLAGSQLATMAANHPPADNSSWSNRYTLVLAATTPKPSTRLARKCQTWLSSVVSEREAVYDYEVAHTLQARRSFARLHRRCGRRNESSSQHHPQHKFSPT